MLVICTIIALAVAVILLIVGKNENSKINEKKFLRVVLAEKYVDFLLDICIVVVGIGLTIILTNYDTKQQEKEITISLLTSLKQELEIMETDLDENYISLYKNFELLGG